VNPGGGDGLATPGSYDGFFYSEQTKGKTTAAAVRGTFTVRISSVERGRLTAHASLQESRVNFSASGWDMVDTNGTCTVVMESRGRVKSTLTLNVREQRMWGVFEEHGQSEPLLIDGVRNGFSGRGGSGEAAESLEKYRGYYTVAMPVADGEALGSADNYPEGVGYLTMTIGSGGKAKIAGLLADGQRVMMSSSLLLYTEGDEEKACVPLFQSLYYKRGSVSGLFWIGSETNRTVVTDHEAGWFIDWYYPGMGHGKSRNNVSSADGFRQLLEACGGYYNSLDAVKAAYTFTVAGSGDMAYYGRSGKGNGAGYVDEALPVGIDVTVTSDYMKMDVGMAPERTDTGYIYSATNCAQATIVSRISTGLFKGMFNIYSDYEESRGKNLRQVHSKERIGYAGVLTPLRDPLFDELPIGMGYYLIGDTDPALKSFRLKRSFPIILEESVEEAP